MRKFIKYVVAYKSGMLKTVNKPQVAFYLLILEPLIGVFNPSYQLGVELSEP